VETRNKAFTVVEILTVVTIIAILLGILLPAITKVKTMVKETEQKAQLNTIDLAIGAFKNDFGYYPPSLMFDSKDRSYCGAQKLAEAMLGQDLLGFHSKSTFNRDGFDDGTFPVDLYPVNLDPSTPTGRQNLQQRKGPYLDDGNKYAFTLKDLKYKNGLGPLEPSGNNDKRYVLCDVFTVNPVTITSTGGKTTNYKAGTPILYYRANTSSKVFYTGPIENRIYNSDDNIELIQRGKIQSGQPHTLVTNNGSSGNAGLYFYDEDYKIVDPKASNLSLNIKWPYRPDSYLLISAGADGEYGTRDDITNIK